MARWQSGYAAGLQIRVGWFDSSPRLHITKVAGLLRGQTGWGSPLNLI